jgi:diadenosine tetraphosphate (Ap4A) HIT family hydrolase
MLCPLCERIQKTNEGEYPFIIHEFKNSFLFLGEHQYYSGYCVLVTKEHFREMTDLPQDIAQEVFQEMMISHKAIQKVFAPKKMNLCSLGNVVDHIHWHFFPRYADDQNFKNPPWLQMNLFDTAKTSPEKRDELIEKLRQSIKEM